MASAIENSLIGATGLSRDSGESIVDWQKRLVAAVSEVGDDDWRTITPEAQDWYNEAAELFSQPALPPFPDHEEDENDEEALEAISDAAMEAAIEEVSEQEAQDSADEIEDTPPETDEPEKPTKPEGGDVQKGKGKMSRAITVADSRRERSRASRDTASSYFRKTMLRHPTWARERVLDKVLDRGHSLSDRYAGILWFETLNLLEVMKELGYEIPEGFVKEVPKVKDARPKNGRKTSRSGATGRKRTAYGAKRKKSKTARRPRSGK